MNGRLLTVAEVAARIRVAESTLYDWRTEKKRQGPPSFKVGGRVVYDSDVVDAWIEQQQQAAQRVAS